MNRDFRILEVEEANKEREMKMREQKTLRGAGNGREDEEDGGVREVGRWRQSGLEWEPAMVIFGRPVACGIGRSPLTPP